MSDSQNKTEKATPKRKQDARNKGQIPRSRETVSFAILVTTAALLLSMSGEIYSRFKRILQDAFYIKQTEIYHYDLLIYKAHQLILSAFYIFIPIFLGCVAAAYFGTIVLGGNLFSLDKIKPKLSNIAPNNALKRIFSSQSVTTLFQTILKCGISLLITYALLKSIYTQVLILPLMPLSDAMHQTAHYVLITFLILSASSFAYCLIDFPYQIYRDNKQLKMSKQEVKDEYKNAEGNPQVKRKIRMQQRKMARRRKGLRNLEKADVVITNPTHYAVALQYDEEIMDAPIVLAAGADHMALYIRRLCTEHKIPILEIPLLARALYNYGEVGERIPEGLFYAVARVIAYIFKLDDPLAFHLDKEWVDQLPIPEEFTKERKK